MSTKLISFASQQVCKLGSVRLMKTVCKQVWTATQTLLRSILQYPNHCETICRAITGKNYSNIAKALAIRVNETQDHTQSDIVTYILIEITILQGALLIGFFIKTQRDVRTRRERRARAAASLRQKLRPSSKEGLHPSVVEESLAKHKLIPKGRLRNSFRYFTSRKKDGRPGECEEALTAESSHL